MVNTGNFRITYWLTGPNALAPDCSSCPGSSDTPPACTDDVCAGAPAAGFTLLDGSVCNDFTGHPDFIRKLGCLFEWTYDKYDTLGFRLPSATINVDVVNIPDIDGISPSAQVNGLTAIWISRTGRPWNYNATVAHEMFHIVQQATWGASPARWFTESLANAVTMTMYPNRIRRSDDLFQFADGDGWDSGFQLFPGSLLARAYHAWPMWNYIMEHSGDGHPDYPGLGFLVDLMENIRSNCNTGPWFACMMGELDNMLAAAGRSFDTEMRRMAFTHMVRAYEDLPFTDPYGVAWDDTLPKSRLRVIPMPWHLDPPVGANPPPSQIAEVINLRTFDLTDASRDFAALPGYTHGSTGTGLLQDYSTQYWAFDNDLRTRIDDAGGLRYPNPGSPWRLRITEPSTADTLGISRLLPFGSGPPPALHTLGIRFDDDRTTGAALAVTSSTALAAYDLAWETDGFSRAVNVDETTALHLEPNEILMLGIHAPAATTFSVVAYWQDASDTSQFQMNIRALEGGFYNNLPLPDLVTPSSPNDWTNLHVMDWFTPTRADDWSDFRLDLRQSRSSTDSGTVYVTVYDQNIVANPLGDLVMADYDLWLTPGRVLHGTLRILNQGTDYITGARVPIMVDGTVVLAPNVDVTAGSFLDYTFTHATASDCSSLPDGFHHEVRIELNSNLGLTFGNPLVPELLMTNNIPIWAGVLQRCNPIPEGTIISHGNGLAESLLEARHDRPGLEGLVHNFGAEHTQPLIDLLISVLGLPPVGPRPPHFPTAEWENLGAFEWMARFDRFLHAMGWGEQVPEIITRLASNKHPSRVPAMATEYYNDAPAPITFSASCEDDPACEWMESTGDNQPDPQAEACPDNCPDDFVQNRGQVKCLTSLRKAVGKFAARKRAANLKCMGRAAKDESFDLRSCYEGKDNHSLLKAAQKVHDTQTKFCAQTPDFGYRNAGVALMHAASEATHLVMDMLPEQGASPPDPAGVRCIRDLARAAAKLEAARYGAFDRCVKNGLKSSEIRSRTGVRTCLKVATSASTTDRKIAKATAKLSQTVDRSCSQGSDAAGWVPESCRSAADRGLCLAGVEACRTCSAVELGSMLFASCDRFDDGELNRSCTGY